MNGQKKTEPPWFKQLWPWLVILPPATAVIAGIITWVIAASGEDSLVVKDYRKTGKIVERLGSHKSPVATMNYSPHTGQVAVRVPGYEKETLHLNLVHPTLARLDQVALLRADPDGAYRGRLTPYSTSRWKVYLTATDNSWKISSATNGSETSLQLR